MSIFGKPTDQDLDQYPPALLTSPHEWDPSILNNAHPNTCGYPSWVTDPSVGDQHDPRIEEWVTSTVELSTLYLSFLIHLPLQSRSMISNPQP